MSYLRISNNEIKAKVKQCDLGKLTSFGIAKDVIKKSKRQPMKRVKIVSNDETDKGLISKIYIQVKITTLK